ncbi:phosphotransferase [Planctomonas deserti]|uniref:phosphotransferase n=1 Tax=Planctomonas deserti TaxID=2144185 RepID=UPI000D33409B|nr:phosphotransferase [Planctomonas deserti]
MARSHLTLAALATSAVPGLDIVRTAPYSSGQHGDYDSALLEDRAGRRLIVRVPRTKSAEDEQTADLVALRSLSTGVRSRLPFRVATWLGEAPIAPTRAYVYEFLPGSPVQLDDIAPGDGLAASIGRAVAAIHSLPTAFVGDAGLPVLSAADAQRAAGGLLDRAAGTSLVPTALLRRWENALNDTSLWQFQPAVVHGSLQSTSFLAEGDAVTAVLGWSELRVGDPARDLNWVLGARRAHVAESVFDAYNAARQVTVDRQLRQRALLYAELEIARWLLHGTDRHDRAVIDDAVSMLGGLADSVGDESSASLSHQTLPAMDVDQVERMLASRRSPMQPSNGERRSSPE